MLKLSIILFCLTVSSCSIRFVGKKSSSRNNSSGKKAIKISDTLRSGKIMEYKDFKNWENEYLEDLNFDIFIDSNGSRTGILNSKNKTQQDTKISKNIFKKQEIKHKDMNTMLKQLEGIFDKNLDSNNQDDEVNAVIVQLSSEKITNITQGEIDIIKEEPQAEEASVMMNYPKIKKRTLSSSSLVKLELVGFDDISSLEKDNAIQDSIMSFAKSCDIFLSRPNSDVKTKNIQLGTGKDWEDVCLKLKKFKTTEINKTNAINYYMENFMPVKIYQKTGFFREKDTGTFTGYYELDLEGSERETSKYQYPIYAMPSECKTRQCATRSQINDGKLSGRGLELFWSDNPLDIYLLQIQGSGVVLLEDGKYARVGFAGTNKRSGKNVFSYMSNKCIPKCKARLDEIIEWFDKNPEKGNDVIAHTDSYIFFRKLDNNGDGAIGAQGVPLTPSRSIAVDNRYIPYGTPIWLETNVAIKNPESDLYVKMSRMLIAQDTGEAIKGPIRGDIFFGHGTKAKYLAEKQKFTGNYYILVPKNLVEKNKVKAR